MARVIGRASRPERTGSSSHRPSRRRTASSSAFKASGWSATYRAAMVDLPIPGGPLRTISRGARVGPGEAEPAVVEPAVVEPAVVEPAVVEPAAVESAEAAVTAPGT